MSASGDEPGRRRTLFTTLLTLLYTGFLLAPVVLFEQAQELHSQVSDYLSVEDAAVLYRTRVELDAAAMLAWRLKAGDPAVTIEELRLAYDLLYGRRETLLNVGMQTGMAPLESFAPAIDALGAAIDAADRSLREPPATSDLSRAASGLIETLAPAGQAVNALIRDSNTASAAARDDVRRRVGTLDEAVAVAMWALLAASPAYVGGLIAINMRLSRSRRRLQGMRDALQRSNAQLLALLEHAPARISIKDLDGRYLMANRRTQEFRRLAESQIIGRRIAELDSSPTAAAIDAQEREVVRLATPISRSYESRDGDSSQWHMVIKFPIRDSDGTVTGVGSFSIDITRERETQQALVRAKEAAEAADRAKTSFLANMSHELRTPLNAVIGFAEVMAGETFGPLGNPRYQEYARDIHRSADHLLGLIGQILDFTRIEGGYWRLDRQPVAPAEIAGEAVRMLWSLARDQKVSVRLDCEAAPATLSADRRALLQILLNLLGNAVKFSPQGTTVTATLATLAQGGLLLTVRDQGPGIAAAELTRLGIPFTRLSDAYQACEGIGLGLSITKSLVALHGGRFELSSTPGEGTAATVEIPDPAVPGEARNAA